MLYDELWVRLLCVHLFLGGRVGVLYVKVVCGNDGQLCLDQCYILDIALGEYVDRPSRLA